MNDASSEHSSANYDLNLLTSEDMQAVDVQVGALGGESRAAIVLLDCPDEHTKSELVHLLTAAQNGRDALESEIPTYFGDDNIRVRLGPGSSSGQKIVEVYARTPKTQLTHPFAFKSVTSHEAVEVFLQQLNRIGSYHLVLGTDGEPDMDKMSMIKYAVDVHT